MVKFSLHALLMFADDIAIMTETEEDLQCMLNTLRTWCESWQLHIKIGLNPYLPYLGVWLDEHLNYHNSVTAKSKQFGNFPFEAFSSLYQSLVMDYGAGVWGHETFPKLQTIQNKAIRHILGVGKICPVDLLEGDSG